MERSGRSRSSADLASAVGRVVAASLLAVLLAGCNLLIDLGDVPVPIDAGADASLGPGTPEAAPPEASPEAGTPGDACADSSACIPCDRDCLGGQCVDGVCQPIALVSPDSGVSPYGLAQDDTFLYWTDYDNSQISRTNKATGVSTVLDSDDTFLPDPIAVDDGGIYWGDSVGVWSCPKSGCSYGVVEVSEEQSFSPSSLAIDDVNIYWTEETGAVFAVPKGGQGAAPTELWEGDASTAGVATDGQRVYFAASDGLLRGVGVDGSAPFAIGSYDDAGSYGVALDGQNVYWTIAGPGEGAVNMASLASLSPSPLATGLHYAQSIASDGANVYWIGATTDTGDQLGIYGCAIASCAPKLLATGSAKVKGIVVDSVAVYWTDASETSTGGGVYKLAK
jgi:hypothetical protein